MNSHLLDFILPIFIRSDFVLLVLNSLSLLSQLHYLIGCDKDFQASEYQKGSSFTTFENICVFVLYVLVCSRVVFDGGFLCLVCILILFSTHVHLLEAEVFSFFSPI